MCLKFEKTNATVSFAGVLLASHCVDRQVARCNTTW